MTFLSKRIPLPTININSVLTLFLLISLFGSISIISFTKGMELFLGGAVLACAAIYLLIQNPRIWIYSVVLSYGVFIQGSGADLSIFDILFASYYLTSLLLWFVYKLFIQRKKIVNTYSEFFLFISFIFIASNSIIASLNEVDLLVWLRFYAVFSLVLFAFPIKDIIRTKKELIVFIILIVVLILFVDINQLAKYYFTFKNKTKFAYQLVNISRAFPIFFTFGSLFIFCVILHKNLNKLMLFCLIFIESLTAIALITTFSRIFWVAYIVGITLIFFLQNSKDRFKLLTIIILLSFIFLGSLITFAPSSSKIVFKMVENRFTSTTQGKSDLSFLSRVYENKAAEKKILELPIGGNGIGKLFERYDPIEKESFQSSFIHFGYYYLLYNFGLPITILYLTTFVLFIFKGIKIYILLKNSLYGTAALSGVLGLLSILIASLAGAQFFQKDGVFIAAFSFALISIAEKLLKEEKLKPRNIKHIC